MILAKARDHPPASTARVWMKSAMVEREGGDAAAERALLQEGLKRFPYAWKMHLMMGQLEERLGGHPLLVLLIIISITIAVPLQQVMWVASRDGFP